MEPISLAVLSISGVIAEILLRPNGQDLDDMFQHYWVLSKTGHGKSVYIREKILPRFLQIAREGSFILFETKDDKNIEVLIDSLPKSVRDKTIVYSPTDMSRWGLWIGLNILQKHNDGLSENTVLTNELIACFQRTFGEAIRSNSVDILRNGAQAVLDVLDKASLLEVYNMFNDDINQKPGSKSANKFRSFIIDKLKNRPLKKYFETNFYYPSMATKDLFNPIYNKLRAIMNDPIMFNCICQLDGLNIDYLINEGYNIIFNFPKSSLGPETSRLFASIAFSLTQLSLQRRGSLSRKERYRRPVMVIADEFQDYAASNTSFDEFLNQARGFGVSLVLANQLTQQRGLDDTLVSTIRGNVGNIILGQLGPVDAIKMRDLFEEEGVREPITTHISLINLDRLVFIERLTKQGKFTKPTRVKVGDFKSVPSTHIKVRKRSLEMLGKPGWMIRKDLDNRLQCKDLTPYGQEEEEKLIKLIK